MRGISRKERGINRKERKERKEVRNLGQFFVLQWSNFLAGCGDFSTTDCTDCTDKRNPCSSVSSVVSSVPRLRLRRSKLFAFFAFFAVNSLVGHCESEVATGPTQSMGRTGRMPVPPLAGALVVAQTPRGSGGGAARDRLDLYYGPGSRVVVAAPVLGAGNVRVLSTGLYAAGGPVVSVDGERVYFAGKAGAESEWQIYEVGVGGGHRRRVTSIPGGAAAPALLADGSVVFASPVPKLGQEGAIARPPQLYAQLPGARPRQLTFGVCGAAEPTVLLDGRVLFVSASAPSPAGSTRGLSLFTINSDGTEITAFACQHDAPAVIGRPRQLADGRVAFLAGDLGGAGVEGSAECVRMARPFLSRAKLVPGLSARLRSVCAEGERGFLVCARDAGSGWAVYRVEEGETELGAPRFEDAGWDCVEAVAARARARAMGRLSSVDAGKKTGQILCLNANDTTYGAKPLPAEAGVPPAVSRIRVLAEVSAGHCRSLGEVVVQEDGSFMAEVPADMALGFEALGQQGQVLRRVEPIMWVRPGENRSCTGCHAAHNRAPHNHRPLALDAPVPCLRVEPEPSPVQTLLPAEAGVPGRNGRGTGAEPGANAAVK